ncbi:hypothetical protein CAEBREN_08294 [Caenorhabditis brenneri]|uniref:Uncharacterized protein n=1 Tax=Caenorhabditis brenneri TaxID=135651 RepID=G0NBY1_CAEBE|nr:hypothetical protein CAEBREN_08294 [Caenorhabditis brenneri]
MFHIYQETMNCPVDMQQRKLPIIRRQRSQRSLQQKDPALPAHDSRRLRTPWSSSESFHVEKIKVALEADCDVAII